ncbi:hypothetical protein Q7P37_008140 [Cladosporium fusiforme]
MSPIQSKMLSPTPTPTPSPQQPLLTQTFATKCALGLAIAFAMDSFRKYDEVSEPAKRYMQGEHNTTLLHVALKACYALLSTLGSAFAGYRMVEGTFAPQAGRQALVRRSWVVRLAFVLVSGVWTCGYRYSKMTAGVAVDFVREQGQTSASSAIWAVAAYFCVVSFVGMLWFMILSKVFAAPETSVSAFSSSERKQKPEA